MYSSGRRPTLSWFKAFAYKRSVAARAGALVKSHYISSVETRKFLVMSCTLATADVLQINSQIIKPEERKILNRLVDIMVSFDLRFVQEKTEEGQLVYRLDPYVRVIQSITYVRCTFF